MYSKLKKCDVIASGIVAAAKNVGIQVPLVVRLEGMYVCIVEYIYIYIYIYSF